MHIVLFPQSTEILELLITLFEHFFAVLRANILYLLAEDGVLKQDIKGRELDPSVAPSPPLGGLLRLTKHGLGGTEIPHVLLEPPLILPDLGHLLQLSVAAGKPVVFVGQSKEFVHGRFGAAEDCGWGELESLQLREVVPVVGLEDEVPGRFALVEGCVHKEEIIPNRNAI